MVRAFMSVCVVSLTGCVADTSDAPHARVIENRGALCLRSADSSDGSGTTRPLNVAVAFDTCLSSSCDTLRESGCALTRAGSTLTLVSHARIESKGGRCTTDCRSATARCISAPLPAGDYILVHGDETHELALPSQAPLVLNDGHSATATCF